MTPRRVTWRRPVYPDRATRPISPPLAIAEVLSSALGPVRLTILRPLSLGGAIHYRVETLDGRKGGGEIGRGCLRLRPALPAAKREAERLLEQLEALAHAGGAVTPRRRL